MSSVRLIKGLKENRLRIFTTRGATTLTGGNTDATVQLLKRLMEEKIILRLKRGVWANGLAPSLRLEEAIPYLTSPWPAYVSLYSALSEHGLIAEIPTRIYAVTSGRPRRIETPLGMIQVHHLPARGMWGFEMRSSGEGSFPLATSEKAYLDTLYLASIPRSPIQTPRFRQRPHFNTKIMQEYLRRWNNPRLKSALSPAGIG